LTNSKEIPNKIVFVPFLEPFFESLDDLTHLPARMRLIGQHEPSKADEGFQACEGSASRQDLSEAGGAAGADCPMIYTSSPQVTHAPPPKVRDSTALTKRALRMYGAVLNGFAIAGRFYFLTLTSSPQSPPLKASWKNLTYWLRRQRPGIEWIYCFTDEGHGVIHMVFRLPMKSKNLDVKKVRQYWIEAHKAQQLKLVRVKNPHDLASYLQQNKTNKKRISAEFLYQPTLQRWNRSKNWLPTGITKHIRRVAFKLRAQPVKVKEICISNYVKRVHSESGALRDPPFVLGGTVYNSMVQYRQLNGGET
jgi:hypothetical protein